MKLIEKIINKFGYFKASRMAEIFNAESNYILPSYGKPTPDNYNTLLTTYQNEVWIYACVYFIATTIAGLPWRLYKKKIKDNKIEKETVWDDNIYKLFERPNQNDENSTFFNLIEMTVANQELIGNAYWLLDELYGFPKKPRSIQNLIASKVRVVPSKTSGMLVDGYNYVLNNGQLEPYAKEEITHFKYMSVTDYHYGQGSLSPALYSIDTIKEAQKANLNIFINGLKIDSFFETDKSLSDFNYKRLQNEIASRYQGSDKSHSSGILEQGLKYKAVTGNMKELEYINGIKLSREDICAVHGVSPLLVGILDKASYANYETALKATFVFCIIPKIKRLNEVITTVVHRFNKNLYFEFDVSNEDVLKDDEKIKSEIATAYHGMGVPFNTINQRLNLGFDDIEGGDTGFLPFNLQPVSVAAEGRPEEPESEPKPKPEPEEGEEGKSKTFIRPFYNKEKKLMLWKQFDRTASIIEKRYMKIIEIYFMGLEMRVLQKLERNKSHLIPIIKEIPLRYSGTEDEREKDIAKRISVETYLFNEEEEIEQWYNQSTKVHELSMKTNGNRELVNLGFGATFDVTNPIVTQYLKKYGLEKSTEVIGSVREDVKNTLIQGVEAGESIPDLKKRIQSVFEPYTDEGYKATRIARTEVIGASNRGALEAYRQADIGAKKAWLSQPDARDTHIDAAHRYSEEKAIPLNKDFHVGMGQGNAPGNIGLAEEDCNCRCSIIPVVEK